MELLVLVDDLWPCLFAQNKSRRTAINGDRFANLETEVLYSLSLSVQIMLFL